MRGRCPRSGRRTAPRSSRRRAGWRDGRRKRRAGQLGRRERLPARALLRRVDERPHPRHQSLGGGAAAARPERQERAGVLYRGRAVGDWTWQGEDTELAVAGRPRGTTRTSARSCQWSVAVSFSASLRQPVKRGVVPVGESVHRRGPRTNWSSATARGRRHGRARMVGQRPAHVDRRGGRRDRGLIPLMEMASYAYQPNSKGMTAAELPGKPIRLAPRAPGRWRAGQRSGHERRGARFACYGRSLQRVGVDTLNARVRIHLRRPEGYLERRPA